MAEQRPPAEPPPGGNEGGPQPAAASSTKNFSDIPNGNPEKTENPNSQDSETHHPATGKGGRSRKKPIATLSPLKGRVGMTTRSTKATASDATNPNESSQEPDVNGGGSGKGTQPITVTEVVSEGKRLSRSSSLPKKQKNKNNQSNNQTAKQAQAARQNSRRLLTKTATQTLHNRRSKQTNSSSSRTRAEAPVPVKWRLRIQGTHAHNANQRKMHAAAHDHATALLNYTPAKRAKHKVGPKPGAESPIPRVRSCSTIANRESFASLHALNTRHPTITFTKTRGKTMRTFTRAPRSILPYPTFILAFSSLGSQGGC